MWEGENDNGTIKLAHTHIVLYLYEMAKLRPEQ